MDSVSICNRDDNRIFHVYRILGSAIALGAPRRANGTEANRLNIMPDHVAKELLLLQVRVAFHFVDGRFDPAVTEKQVHFWNRHVGGTDRANQP